MKIAVFVGSLREKSLNKNLAKSLEALVPEGVEFAYADINVPLYNQDFDGDYPPEATRLKQLVEASDGVLFVTPEYNRSVPGVLKNAIDWASRPWGTNSFKGKPVGIAGASIGPVGTAVAQSDLRHIVAFLEMKLMGQPEVHMANMTEEMFDANGVVTDERWRKNLAAYMQAFAAWVEAER